MSDSYPHHPGDRGVDTSIIAADALAPDLGRMQRLVFEAVQASGPRGLTTDEIAATIGMARWSCQPRTSELRRLGKIRDSRMRRPSAANRPSIVWVAKEVAHV